MRHADPTDVDTTGDTVTLPPAGRELADIFDRAWSTVAGRHWQEAGAMRAVYGPGLVRDGLRALPVLEQLDALHQPIHWPAPSTVVVCSCGLGAYDSCPSAQALEEFR